MTTIDHGMNVDEVEKLGHQLQDNYAAQIRDQVGQIEKLVGSATNCWAGKDADDFRSWWPGKRKRLLALAEDLHGYGQSALNNASEQRKTSGEGAPSGTSDVPNPPGAAMHDLDSHSYEVTTAGSAWLVGTAAATLVTVARQSDGTYRVELSAEDSADFGIGIRRILGVDGPGDLGLEVGTSAGYRIGFTADSPEAAAALQAALQGRASSLTNRTLAGGGVDPSEVLTRENLERAGVHLSTVTVVHPGASVTATGEMAEHGVNESMERHNETTYNVADRTVTDRTVWKFDAVDKGWNQDGAREEWRSEITHDASGNVVASSVEITRQQVADVRSGFDKAFDVALGKAADNSNQQVTTVVHHYDIDTAGGTSAMQAAVAGGDRIGLLNAVNADPKAAALTSTTYVGHLDSATRGVGVASSTTAYGDATLQSVTYRPASP